MKQFFFTFGRGHHHNIGGKVFDFGTVAVLEAETEESSREIAFSLFGHEFGTSYDSEIWNPDWNPMFPGGFIKCNSLVKKTLVVDVDGTISQVGERLKFITQNPKNWDLFYASSFDDAPVPEICRLVKMYHDAGYPIVFNTGRKEAVREITINWISKHISPEVAADCIMLMRANQDFRSDEEVKPENLDRIGLTPDKVEFMLDDRLKVTAKFRSLGYKVLQVAEGNY